LANFPTPRSSWKCGLNQSTGLNTKEGQKKKKKENKKGEKKHREIDG